MRCLSLATSKAMTSPTAFVRPRLPHPLVFVFDALTVNLSRGPQARALLQGEERPTSAFDLQVDDLRRRAADMCRGVWRCPVQEGSRGPRDRARGARPSSRSENHRGRRGHHLAVAEIHRSDGVLPSAATGHNFAVGSVVSTHYRPLLPADGRRRCHPASSATPVEPALGGRSGACHTGQQHFGVTHVGGRSPTDIFTDSLHTSTHDVGISRPAVPRRGHEGR